MGNMTQSTRIFYVSSSQYKKLNLLMFSSLISLNFVEQNNQYKFKNLNLALTSKTRELAIFLILKHVIE